MMDLAELGRISGRIAFFLMPVIVVANYYYCKRKNKEPKTKLGKWWHRNFEG